MRKEIRELAPGQRFIHHHTRYEVLVSASEDTNGFVHVRDLSMTGGEAEALLATPGAVEPGCDPREGFLSFSAATYVEVVD